METLRSGVGPPRRKAKQRYRAYVEEAIREGLEESPWERVEAQLVLGGAALKDKARSLLGGSSARERSGLRELRRREFGAVIAVVSQLKREAWEDFRDRYGDWGRDLALWLGRTHCDLRLRELGELAGGLDYATVSAATIRWRKRMANDKSLAKLAKRAEQLLNAKI